MLELQVETLKSDSWSDIKKALKNLIETFDELLLEEDDEGMFKFEHLLDEYKEKYDNDKFDVISAIICKMCKHGEDFSFEILENEQKQITTIIVAFVY